MFTAMCEKQNSFLRFLCLYWGFRKPEKCTLQKEAAGSSEWMVPIYQLSRGHIPGPFIWVYAVFTTGRF